MSSKSNYSRVIGFDVLKIIAAFLVVCIHQKFSGEFGLYFTTVARCAVPIFLIITGFFYCDSVKNNSVNKQIIKVIKLILFANLIYFLYHFIDCIIRNINFLSFLKNLYSLKNIFQLILFNRSLMTNHLWYLYMLLYVLLLMKYIYNTKLYRFICYLIPLFLIFSLIFNQYSMILFNRTFFYVYVRNFVFAGLPYFCIGDLIRNKKNNIIFTNNTIIITIFSSCIFVLFERFFLVKYGFNYDGEYYIGTVLMAVFLVLFSLDVKINKLSLSLASLGRKYSTYIYVFHLLPIRIINTYNLGVYFPLYDSLGPIYIFLLSILISKLIYLIKGLKKA